MAKYVDELEVSASTWEVHRRWKTMENPPFFVPWIVGCRVVPPVALVRGLMFIYGGWHGLWCSKRKAMFIYKQVG